MRIEEKVDNLEMQINVLANLQLDWKKNFGEEYLGGIEQLRLTEKAFQNLQGKFVEEKINLEAIVTKIDATSAKFNDYHNSLRWATWLNKFCLVVIVSMVVGIIALVLTIFSFKKDNKDLESKFETLRIENARIVEVLRGDRKFFFDEKQHKLYWEYRKK